MWLLLGIALGVWMRTRPHYLPLEMLTSGALVTAAELNRTFIKRIGAGPTTTTPLHQTKATENADDALPQGGLT